MRKLELLAPARDAGSGKIAIDHGADAVYIGGPVFGARQAARNTVEESAELVQYARRFGVRVYAAMNTVLFEDELEKARVVALELVAAGVDALIIQDMAYLRMDIKGVEFHASTQTANTAPERVLFLEKAGFTRVILERGLTLDQIKEIRKVTAVELECFVHGAICVGTSGKCYLSRSMGPRSGNRGECSQPCRQTYDLVDGQGKVLVPCKHLLSVRDLNLSDSISSLIDAGVDSFKTEGRLKGDAYIKNVVTHYRGILDREIDLRDDCVAAASGSVRSGFRPDPAKSFTRGFTSWMLDGKSAGSASFDTPKAMGEYLGSVRKSEKGGFYLSQGVKLTAGDGICFLADGELKGTNVNRVEGDRIVPNRMDGIGRGTEIYRNFDKAFDDILSADRTRRILDVGAELTVSQKRVSLLLCCEADGDRVEETVDGPFDRAADPDKMERTIRTQIAKTGDTIFNITAIKVEVEGEDMPFIPAGVLNALRRKATESLLARRVGAAKGKHMHTEDLAFPYPCDILTADENVTNSLAEKFYRDHGVRQIEPGHDLRHPYDFAGVQVMRTAYCLRREIGQCLRDCPQTNEPLFIRRGSYIYRLGFDCRRCEMTITKEPKI